MIKSLKLESTLFGLKVLSWKKISPLIVMNLLMTKTKQKLKKTPRDNNNILPQINKLRKRNTKLKNLKFKI